VPRRHKKREFIQIKKVILLSFLTVMCTDRTILRALKNPSLQCLEEKG
jgi:hypothetical protein